MDIEDIPEIEESHWGKRVGAFVIDSILVGFLTICILLIFGLFNFNIIWILTVWSIIFGIIFILYAGSLEGGIGATIGKWAMSLEVVAINSEMTAGKGFGRNISKIHWIILIIDTLIGYSAAGDPRQRQLDKSVNTIVVRAIPTEFAGPRMPYIAPLPTKDEGDEDRSEWEIPEELLSGNCSLCHTPYKILPPEDRKSWSGLWNSRCIWCNKLVFEDYKRRKEPDTWRSPRHESWRDQSPPEHWRAPPRTWRSTSPSWR